MFFIAEENNDDLKLLIIYSVDIRFFVSTMAQ